MLYLQAMQGLFFNKVTQTRAAISCLGLEISQKSHSVLISSGMGSGAHLGYSRVGISNTWRNVQPKKYESLGFRQAHIPAQGIMGYT